MRTKITGDNNQVSNHHENKVVNNNYYSSRKGLVWLIGLIASLITIGLFVYEYLEDIDIKDKDFYQRTR